MGQRGALIRMPKKACASCGNNMIGGARARYCSPACKQRAHRSRKGANRNGSRQSVTVPATGGQPTVHGGGQSHCAEALALLASLDAELAANAEELGQELEFSAAENVVRGLIADTVDRRVDLWARYHASDQTKERLTLSAEIRLLDTSLARLLRQVSPDVPEPQSRTSQKAAAAAAVRWRRDGAHR
jgi:hypothetical protein